MGVEKLDIVTGVVDSNEHNNNCKLSQNASNTSEVSTEVDRLLNSTDAETNSKDKYEFSQESAAKDDRESSTYLKLLMEGANVHGDSGIPMDKPPDWFDINKFKRGQAFAMQHFFGVMNAEMLSLFLLFSVPNSLSPLIFTGKSDTPFKAFKRYLSTALRVKSWYQGDFWSSDSSARKNLKYVRAIHDKVRRDMTSCPSDKLKEKSSLKADEGIWSSKLEELNEGFNAHYLGCPVACNIMSLYVEKSIFVSQFEMAATQFGFVGLMILYPDKFGAPDATEEDLDSFLHVWRTIGFCLGIQDKYNFCDGTLEEIRMRSRTLIRYGYIPSMAKLTSDWEHMSRCLVEGISYYVQGLTFEVSLYYLTRVLGIHAPKLYEMMSFPQRLRFSCMWFILTVLHRFAWARTFFNWVTLVSLKKARNGSKEWLKSLEDKTCPYQVIT